MEKIIKVIANDLTASTSTEYDIRVYPTEENRADLVVDLIVHYIVSNEDEPDKMTVNYAAAFSFIKNVSGEYLEKACTHLDKIVNNSFKSLKLP